MAAFAMVGLTALISVFFISADTASNSYATSVESEITAEIDGTHYVTLSAPDITFSITPSSTAQLSKQNINVNVETNANGGADLYLAMSGNTNALHLNGDTTSTAPAIEATASSVAANALAANTWGYSTDDQTYSAVPTSNSDPALLANVDGSTVGTTTSDVITASVPVYFAASVDTSIPAGSYSNRLTYSAVVDGGIITEATLTKIEIGGEEVENMQPEVENTLLITTNLMTNTYGTPRVYYETTNPAGYQECNSVTVGRNESGYMTITCKVTPSQAATGVTLHIVPKGSSDNVFCTNGDYQLDTSDCEAGEWKWGSFVVEAPDIVAAIFNGITTMQDMTPEICAAAKEGDTVRLRDARDDKMYWVAKLADGNCWMTQNLDLDLNTVGTLTPENSDVSADWNFNDAGGQWCTNANEHQATGVVIDACDLGEYVWKPPNNADYCSPDTNFSDSSCSPYWQSTSGMTPMTKPRTDGVTVIGDTYDAHYLAGNYYSWDAATADSGEFVEGSAANSICPASWRLPISNTTENGSFYHLLEQYGLASSPTSGNDITMSPLYFVRSGKIGDHTSLSRAGLRPQSQGLNNAGSEGYYRSGQGWASLSSYDLYISPSSVDPLFEGYRYDSQSVRCVADWE